MLDKYKTYAIKINISNELSVLRYIESLKVVRWSGGQAPTEWLPSKNNVYNEQDKFLKIWYVNKYTWAMIVLHELYGDEVVYNLLEMKLNRIL